MLTLAESLSGPMNATIVLGSASGHVTSIQLVSHIQQHIAITIFHTRLGGEWPSSILHEEH